MRLDLSAQQQGLLLGYLQLLSKWNQTYNLTAVREPQAMLVQHVLDCLAVVVPMHTMMGCGDAATRIELLDVGSGAGLPGLVLAIACPQIQVTTLDAVQKKVAFMAQAIIELNLRNVRAVHSRVEKFIPERAPTVVISRAYASLTNFINGISHIANGDTIVIAMKGQHPQQEIADLPASWRLLAAEPLTVPQLHAERTLIFLRRH